MTSVLSVWVVGGFRESLGIVVDVRPCVLIKQSVHWLRSRQSTLKWNRAALVASLANALVMLSLAAEDGYSVLCYLYELVVMEYQAPSSQNINKDNKLLLQPQGVVIGRPLTKRSAASLTSVRRPQRINIGPRYYTQVESNHDLPIIGSLVYCENDTLKLAGTEILKNDNWPQALNLGSLALTPMLYHLSIQDSQQAQFRSIETQFDAALKDEVHCYISVDSVNHEVKQEEYNPRVLEQVRSSTEMNVKLYYEEYEPEYSIACLPGSEYKNTRTAWFSGRTIQGVTLEIDKTTAVELNTTSALANYATEAVVVKKCRADVRGSVGAMVPTGLGLMTPGLNKLKMKRQCILRNKASYGPHKTTWFLTIRVSASIPPIWVVQSSWSIVLFSSWAMTSLVEGYQQFLKSIMSKAASDEKLFKCRQKVVIRFQDTFDGYSRNYEMGVDERANFCHYATSGLRKRYTHNTLRFGWRGVDLTFLLCQLISAFLFGVVMVVVFIYFRLDPLFPGVGEALVAPEF
uniref:Uncharacterized protein n=1 Tax=Timema monikensis TaxID=170555 RepID=A0A7R9DXP6_9NEOP|nr:unnamed protein product [Timema monikensis]